MSYTTINKCANDPAFRDRLLSCIAQEQGVLEQAPNPARYQEPFRWAVAGATDVEAAYASALAALNPNPGGDPAVITDQMILSHVQASWDAVTAAPPTGPPL